MKNIFKYLLVVIFLFFSFVEVQAYINPYILGSLDDYVCDGTPNWGGGDVVESFERRATDTGNGDL